MSTIATICARGGSQGVPGKNIRPLCGKPLIVWTIEQALAFPGIAEVHVSTDSEAIAEVAQSAGANVPFLRPAELATASAGKLPAIIHLVEFLEAEGREFDTVVDLDPTSPLRDLEDIAACLALLDAGAPCAITAYPADKNPYFNMIELDGRGVARLSKRAPDGAVLSRQAAPAVYAMNASIYAWRREALGSDLWASEPRLHIMPRERSIDIDSEIDFKLVEWLLEAKLSA